MKKLVSLVTLLTFFLSAKAQTRGFGNIDTADLRLSSCDFEKGANAEVLFDKAYVHYNYGAVVMDRHTRIKIFTDKGKDDAKVRIEFYGAHKDEEISDIEAETINLNNDVITYSPVDKTTIYTEKVDQDKRAIVFTFPNVKPGSIVEYKYRWHTPYSGNYPDWVFQHDVPTRYSELQAELTNDLTFKLISKVKQKFALDTIYPTKIKNDNGGKKYVWALNNVHSYKEEPFMTAIDENVQALYFQVSYYNRSWFSLTNNLLSSEDFGKQLDTAIDLTNENTVLNKMQSFKTTDEKIGYAFNLIKSTIQWNDYVGIYTDDGIKKTWNRKKGAASDINLLVYHFLKKSGVNAYPIAVNTHRKIETGYASLRQCNKTIVFVKVDSTRQYILDASEKDNVYNDIPYNLLNSNGLLIDPQSKVPRFLTFESDHPSRKVVYVNAQIVPDGKIKGTAQIGNFSYNRIAVIKKYKDDGEKKYIDYLRNGDNNLKISSLKQENMEIDSLPLMQNIDFDLDLAGSDDNYIYFSPNLFTGLNSNPFLSEERFSNIDFKFLNNYNITGRYKLPAGYKIDALPKSVSMSMPDKSINFKRVAAEEDGLLMIHYIIAFKRSYYTKDEYEALHDFFKKMHEMLSEQIVLKKT